MSPKKGTKERKLRKCLYINGKKIEIKISQQQKMAKKWLVIRVMRKYLGLFRVNKGSLRGHIRAHFVYLFTSLL